MRFRILGPLEILDGAGWAQLRQPKQRTLLAMLLINANTTVGAGQLVDQLWGEHAPRTATNLVQQYVMRLRRVLQDPDGRLLTTRPPGYRLVLDDPEDLDAQRFARLLDAGQGAMTAGQAERAAGLLAEALGLWRGPALADVPPSPAVDAEAARLGERRLGALELRIDADLACGRHTELVGELRTLVRDQPLRERLWEQLVVALYRSGRQADALAAYREVYQLLADELGVEPGARLQRLHQQILRADPALDGPCPPPDPLGPPPAAAEAGAGAVARQLPADVAGFTGRDRDLRQLDALVSAGGAPPPTAVVVTAIAGSAGVGKTALAVHWAHRVADRFEDGQLYVNLRGHARIPPLRPVQALAQLLGGLGVPPEQIPVEVEQAAGMYRTLLADRRILVLLDNAADAAQVRPLLPGSPSCLVVVTSRDRLSGLVARDGARPHELDVLTPEEAGALVAAIVGDARAAAEPAAVAELGRLCAHLPLALRIAAANLAGDPHQPIAGYVTELAGGDRLAALAVGGDEDATVRAAFDLSTRRLARQERRFFRALGLAPGPDVTTDAAAALAGVPAEQAARLLGRLTDAHLLQEHQPGRYVFHDLLRLYAAELADTHGGEQLRAAAVGRLLDWYLDRTAAAAQLLYPEILRLPTPQRSGDRPASAFASSDQALAWLDAERANLVAAVGHAADHGPHQQAWQLSDALRGYFWSRRYAADWLAVARAGVAAADAGAAPQGLAAAHLNLADAYQCLGRTEEAIESYRTALALAELCGWLEGQGSALGNLGMLHMDTGRLEQAAERFTASLHVQRLTGWQQGEANNLGNLAAINFMLGRLEQAADHCRRALALYRQTGSRAGEAGALFYLGCVQRDLGRLGEALDHITRSLALTRQVGMRDEEVTVLAGLATVHRELGDHPRARELAQTALELAREIGEPRLEADAHATLATVHAGFGHHDQALTQHLRAVTLARAGGSHYTEVQARIGLAAAHQQLRRSSTAMTCARQALTAARRAGFRDLEGQALTALADVHLARDRADHAACRARQAVDCHRQTGHGLALARALRTLSDAEHRTGAVDTAASHRRQALALFTDAGSRHEADQLRGRPDARGMPHSTTRS